MILKPAFYDDFYCIADKCPVCCCYGLDIILDKEETARYMSAEGEKARDYLSFNSDGTSTIKHSDVHGGCGFLTDEGLCSLVLKYGEMFIDNTCHVFPRFEYTYNDLTEKYLSNACPAVLDFLLNTKTPLEFVCTDEEMIPSDYSPVIDDPHLSYRDGLIDIMQNSKYPIWFKLFLIKRYSDKLDKTKDIAKIVDEMSTPGINDEIFALFPEMRANSINQLKILHTIISSIVTDAHRKPNKNADIVYEYVHSAETLIKDADKAVKIWEEFKIFLSKYDGFFENFMVNHLFMHSWYLHLQDEQNYSVKNLILEYALIRFTLFLAFANNDDKLIEEDFYKIVVFLARKFEHGRDETVKYLKENSEHVCLSDAAFIEMIL